MKMKYVMAIGALGSTLAIVPICTSVSAVTSSPMTGEPTVAPAMPATAVWDCSEYVGEVNGTYYYQGPNNTWFALDQDQARQQRFEDWQRNHPTQSNQAENTRSAGGAKGLNASEQTGQMQNINPNATSPIRDTRYQGHNMGQGYSIAPPLHPE
jgi:hypothetical protein